MNAVRRKHDEFSQVDARDDRPMKARLHLLKALIPVASVLKGRCCTGPVWISDVSFSKSHFCFPVASRISLRTPGRFTEIKTATGVTSYPPALSKDPEAKAGFRGQTSPEVVFCAAAWALCGCFRRRATLCV